MFLLLANLLMLFVGCFLEPTAAITILVPILLPIARQLGIDPVHFGLVMVLNLMIGLLHPPMGMVLFVLARVAKLSFERTTMAILPWLVPLLVSLVIITYVPQARPLAAAGCSSEPASPRLAATALGLPWSASARRSRDRYRHLGDRSTGSLLRSATVRIVLRRRAVVDAERSWPCRGSRRNGPGHAVHGVAGDHLARETGAGIGLCGMDGPSGKVRSTM